LAPPLVGEQPAVDDGGRLALYGDQTVPQIAVIDLPAWAELYSVFGWPLLWGFTEEVCTSGTSCHASRSSPGARGCRS